MTEVKVDASLFQCGHLERLPLGTSYPAVVAHVGRLLAKLPAGTELVIDYTGVGRPVFDVFLSAGLSPVGVLITAGTGEAQEGMIHSVPKLVLISRLQVLLHEARLKIHKDLPEAEVLIREMQDFRVEFTASGALTFNARSGKHDDLVLAVAIACWRAYGVNGPGMNVYEYYRQLSGGEEQPRTVVGVDLGQSRDPTAIAVVRRVPVTRVEERAPPPTLGQAARPRVETTYARGSLEYMRQQLEQQEARQRAAAEAAEDPWVPAGHPPAA